MRKFLSAGICVCLVCILIGGCGQNRFPGVVPAEGIIMLSGEPLDGANVIFYPEEVRADHVVVVSQTDQDGRFVLRTHGEVNGAYPGSYKVVVSKSRFVGYINNNPENGREYALVTPIKYSQQSTTDLVITIPPGGDRNIMVNLE